MSPNPAWGYASEAWWFGDGEGAVEGVLAGEELLVSVNSPSVDWKPWRIWPDEHEGEVVWRLSNERRRRVGES